MGEGMKMTSHVSIKRQIIVCIDSVLTLVLVLLMFRLIYQPYLALGGIPSLSGHAKRASIDLVSKNWFQTMSALL